MFYAGDILVLVFIPTFEETISVILIYMRGFIVNSRR